MLKIPTVFSSPATSGQGKKELLISIKTPPLTTLPNQVWKTAGTVQDVGCRKIPFYEDDKVNFPHIHDAGKGAQDPDRRDHPAWRYGRHDKKTCTWKLDGGQGVCNFYAGK